MKYKTQQQDAMERQVAHVLPFKLFSQPQSHTMFSHSLSLFAALASACTTVFAASGVIVPLYIDPGSTSCSAWQPLLKAFVSFSTLGACTRLTHHPQHLRTLLRPVLPHREPGQRPRQRLRARLNLSELHPEAEAVVECRRRRLRRDGIRLDG